MIGTENPTHCHWVLGGWSAYFNTGLWSKGEGNGKWNTTGDLNLVPDKSPVKCNESKNKSLKGNITYVVWKSTTVTWNQLILRWLHSHTYSKRHGNIFWVSNLFSVSTCSKVNPHGPERSILFQRQYILWFEHEVVTRPNNAINGTSTCLDIGTINVERKILQMIKTSISQSAEWIYGSVKEYQKKVST